VTNDRILLVIRCGNEIIVTGQIRRFGRSFVANSCRCRKVKSDPRRWVVLLTGSVGVLPSYGITPSVADWQCGGITFLRYYTFSELVIGKNYKY